MRHAAVPSTAVLPAVIPLAAAVAAVLATAATGFDQRSAMPPLVEERFYGFFLDSFPLFAFAIVYGAARLLVLMAGPGDSSSIRRLLGGMAGLTLLAGASLHPTFGGLVLRAAFATGGMAFLGHQPLMVAHALGALAGAFVFGSVLGLASLLIGGRGRRGLGWRRRLTGAGATLPTRFLALWFAFAVLRLAPGAGFGPWPRRPLTGDEAGIAAALVLAAFLPHVVLVVRSARDRSSRGRAGDGLIRSAGYR